MAFGFFVHTLQTLFVHSITLQKDCFFAYRHSSTVVLCGWQRFSWKRQLALKIRTIAHSSFICQKCSFFSKSLHISWATKNRGYRNAESGNEKQIKFRALTSKTHYCVTTNTNMFQKYLIEEYNRACGEIKLWFSSFMPQLLELVQFE